MNNMLRQLKAEVNSWAIRREPSFYSHHTAALTCARNIFFDHPLLRRCREDVLPFLNDGFGHGIEHSKKVAIEAAAIIISECESLGMQTCRHLALCAELAGLIHDICRMEPDHAAQGAVMSGFILQDYPLSDEDKAMIAFAVRNHEAFKPTEQAPDTAFALLSGAVYDADKFRWGPDNFVTTLWEICDYQEWPLEKIVERFPRGIEMVASIKDTFRTPTGQTYGPEFIDVGLELGHHVYRRLKALCAENDCAGLTLTSEFNL
ncbi:MAG: hypothetical protein ACQESV_06205 [Thermodesulfobacteriota bacterium]